ncbi:odorant receptor 13a-like [Bacillus rossius redtenbacheri]|uniref:odorant receptor 13a-like n=1 Tax=Bacillus rossius redtenbacheri TaxID=93214 RepID=UPI002FDCD3ED
MRLASRRAGLLTRGFGAVVLLMVAAWTAPAAFQTPSPRRALPFQAAYFFDHRRSPAYEAAYCFQVASATLIAGMVVSYDTTTAAFLIHAAGQLQVLKCSLRGLRGAALAPGPRRRLLADCVRHHDAVTAFVKELDNVYHPFMMMQFLYSVFIIALSVFLATESSTNTSDLFKFMALVLASSSELFLFCRYGDAIIQLSGEVATEAYSMEWYEEDEEFKAMVLMMITRAQKPAKLTAFRYKDISLETYGALLNSSYTYFALLKELK